MSSAIEGELRHFDNYEALINLDENLVHPVPERLINMLPISKFTEGNK